MSVFLKENKADKKLNYYQRGWADIVGDKFCLLGFTDNLPVVTTAELKFRDKGGNNLLSMIAVQKDKQGKMFITVKGQKLRVVPSNQIPEGVRQQTILLKKSVAVNGLKNAPQIHVINDISSESNTSLVKQTDNTCLGFTSDDIPDSSTTTNVAVTTHNANVTSLVKPILKFDPQFISWDSTTDCTKDVLDHIDVVELLPKHTPSTKLLCEENLKVLNQVKMQALNLSMKKNMVVKKLIWKTMEMQKTSVEVGIQTEAWESKFQHRGVQTEFEADRFIIPPLESYDHRMDSVVLNDVNFGMGPSIEKIVGTKVHGATDVTKMSPVPVKCLISASSKNEETTMKKLMFFEALHKCAQYNVSGNLPLHEGVIRNDLDAVKVQCVALKARKLSVNMETHEGCTPLQLAIIHDVHPDIVKTLLDYGADIKDVDGEGNNILHLGAKFQRHEALGIILVHEAFDKCFNCIDDYNFEGLTPLMICCMRSWTAGALLFIGNRANVNCRDQTSGRTALFHAAEAQNADIVRILLDHHADPKIKNFFGTSPHDAMYELDDMSEVIKNLIFGRSKKRCIEAEMNPVRTAKAAKKLKTYPKLQKIDRKGNVFIAPVVRQRIVQQIK